MNSCSFGDVDVTKKVLGLTIKEGTGAAGDGDKLHDQEEEEPTTVIDIDAQNLEVAVDTFLHPLRTGLRTLHQLRFETTTNTEETKTTDEFDANADTDTHIISLLMSLCKFIWEPGALYLQKSILHRNLNQLKYYFLIQDGQSDLDDFLEYRPCEIMAFKAMQVFAALTLPNVQLFFDEMKNFHSLIQDSRISIDQDLEQAYLFLLGTFERLYEVLVGEKLRERLIQSYEPFEKLSNCSKAVVRASSVMFSKTFKLYPRERVVKMQRIVKDDDSSFEWRLTLAEMLRLKRRDFRGGAYSTSYNVSKLVTQEEIDLIQTSLTIAPENPFVRLAVCDTIIGLVRDSSGKFHCGNIHLDSFEDSMRYLQYECIKLTEDFPKNVYLNSIIADYFVRYFPFAYFNRDISYRLMKSVVELNPMHPKTTHRLGILMRMSFADIGQSLKWLEKTVKLDPTHFNGTLEYFKTVIGRRGKDIEVTKQIQLALDSSNSAGWTQIEKSELKFYLGLTYFIQNDKEMAVKCWKQASKDDETHFTLSDMLTTIENFQWDSDLVTIDKIRLWLQQEKDERAAEEPSAENMENKRFINRMFEISLGRIYPSFTRVLFGFEKNLPGNYAQQFASLE